MSIKIVHTTVSRQELTEMANIQFGNLVKAVVDIEGGIMAIGGELHADEEKLLLEEGSLQENLWGINLYPELKGDDWIEFDSMINIRPWLNNLTRNVNDKNIQIKIIEIVNKLTS